MDELTSEQVLSPSCPPLFVDTDLLEKTMKPKPKPEVKKRARVGVKQATKEFKEPKPRGRPRKKDLAAIPSTPQATPVPSIASVTLPSAQYMPMPMASSAEEELENSKTDLRLYIIWEGAQRGYTKEVMKAKFDEIDKLTPQDVMFELSCYKAQQQTQTNSHLARIARDSIGKLLDVTLKTNGQIEKALQNDPVFQEALSSTLDTYSARLSSPMRLGLALGSNIFKGFMEKLRNPVQMIPPNITPATATTSE